MSGCGSVPVSEADAAATPRPTFASVPPTTGLPQPPAETEAPEDCPLLETDASSPLSAADRRALTSLGYGDAPSEHLVVEGVHVVSVISAETADAHAQNVLFLREGRVLASDRKTEARRRTHFTANICGDFDGTELRTAYTVNLLPGGPAPGCPEPTVVKVRWRVSSSAVKRLDPLPSNCAD